MDVEHTHKNMITNQIIPWGVNEPNLLNIISELKREEFVPQDFRNFSYSDIPIPIGNQEVMLPPKEQALIIQELKIKPTDKILEIGTGTGYMTAIMAKLGHSVTSIEIEPKLLKKAAKIIKELKLDNVTLEEGDGSCGWDQNENYDVIVISGSLKKLPEVFKESLNLNGRLAAIIGDYPIMKLMLLTRDEYGHWQERSLFETCVSPLITKKSKDYEKYSI